MAINLAEQQISALSSNIWKPCCLHCIILSFKQNASPSHTTSVWGAVVSNPDRSSATWKSWSSFVEANYDPPHPSLRCFTLDSSESFRTCCESCLGGKRRPVLSSSIHHFCKYLNKMEAIIREELNVERRTLLTRNKSQFINFSSK